MSHVMSLHNLQGYSQVSYHKFRDSLLIVGPAQPAVDKAVQGEACFGLL